MNPKTSFLLCISVAMLLSSVIGAQTTGTTFAPPETIVIVPPQSLSFSNRIRLVDFIGSPHPDIVRLVGVSNLEVIDLHAPGGTSVTTQPLPFGGPTFDVGDINGDGIIDAVIGHQTAVLSLVTSSPSGRQTSTLTGPFAPFNARPYIRDLNGDGLVDITYGPGVYIQSPNGSFSVMSIPNHPTFSSIRNTVPGDFDGDGDVDFVVLGTSPGGQVYLELLRANGPLMTTATALITAIQDGVSTEGATIEVADMDGDLADDIVLWAGPNAFGTVKTVAVYRVGESANLTLHSTFEYHSKSIVGELLLRDLNADGKLDVVLNGSNEPGATLSIGSVVTSLINDGLGHLSPPADQGFLACNGVIARGRMDLADLELDGGLWAVFNQPALPNALLGPFSRSMRLPAGSSLPATLAQVAPTAVPALQQTSILPLNSTVTINAEARYVASGVQRNGGGLFVDLTSNAMGASIGQLAGTRPSLSDFDGRVGVPITIGSGVGTVDIVMSTAAGVSTTRHYGVGDAIITLLSGNQQVTGVGLPFPSPLVVRVTSFAGEVLPDTIVTLQTSGAPVSIPGNMLSTDVDGTASITATAGATPGTISVTAGILPARSVAFSLLSFVGTGPIEASPVDVRIGESATASVRVLTPGGQPIPGVTVTFTGDPAFVSFTSSANPLTDSLGIASVTFLAGPASGMTSITASTPQGVTSVPVRVFGVSHLDLATEFIAVRFDDPRPNLPILITFDLPLPQPIPTSLGVFHTSILHPSIYLQSLDGIGYFGFANPSYRTDPSGTWFQLFFVLPGLGGVTVVTQVHAYDDTLPFPHSVTVSNAVYRTF